MATHQYGMYMAKFKIRFLGILFFIGISVSVYADGQNYSLDEELIYRLNFGRADDIKLLLARGANPNAISKTKDSALTIAVGRDDAESEPIVKLLLDKGANPNVADSSGYYPIMTAITNGKPLIIKDLLAKRADFHVKTANGKNLLELAKTNNNPEVIAIIKAEFDKEAEFMASLHTPERFKSIIQNYISASCIYQYWSFVKSSRQMTDKEAEIDDIIARNKAEITIAIEEIQKYYPSTPASDLQKASGDASQKIYDTLDAMISNYNRSHNGVGTQEDAASRCSKIVDSVAIEFPPSAYK